MTGQKPNDLMAEQVKAAIESLESAERLDLGIIEAAEDAAIQLAKIGGAPVDIAKFQLISQQTSEHLNQVQALLQSAKNLAATIERNTGK